MARWAVLLVLAAMLTAADLQTEPPVEIIGFSVAPDLSIASVDLGSTRVTVTLAFTDEPRMQAVQHEGFTVEYYPPSLYDELGSPLPGTILLVSSIPHRPTTSRVPGGPEGMERPARPWTADGLPATLTSLYSAFDRLNQSSIGTLCDEERTGLWTYRAMESGACFVWCTGYASMTADFLRTAGTAARRLHLGAYAETLPSGVLVQSSEGHTTVERWDGERWVWVDPTFRVREATLAGRALSLHDVIVALADRSIRDRVTFTRFLDGEWVAATYADQDADFRDALRRYFTGDKRLTADR
jgi:hypothetical protein